MPSPNVGRINSATLPNPESIYKALIRAVTLLDKVSNSEPAWLDSAISYRDSAREDARQWAWALLTVIDELDITTDEVKAIANRIWKGAQDAFDHM